jgi:hypothetical protein
VWYITVSSGAGDHVEDEHMQGTPVAGNALHIEVGSFTGYNTKPTMFEDVG